METRRDLLLSLLFTIGLHAGLITLLYFGLWWSRPPTTLSVAGPVIEAVLVSDPGGGRTPPRPAPAKPATPPAPAPEPVAPPPQPEPTPSPQRAEVPPQPMPQMPVPQPETREQERAARLVREQEEKARAEAIEKRRQEQILLEQQARKAEAERRERLRRQVEEETERKLAEIRKQREAAERASRLASERLRQIRDRQTKVGAPGAEHGPPAPAPVRAGNEGSDESLLGQYTIAIQRAIERNWLRPETVRPGLECKMRIRQIVGGEVIAVAIDASCPYDDLGRRSIEAAVLKAQPLPYAGFESVFRPDLLFTFKAPES